MHIEKCQCTCKHTQAERNLEKDTLYIFGEVLLQEIVKSEKGKCCTPKRFHIAEKSIHEGTNIKMYGTLK